MGPTPPIPPEPPKPKEEKERCAEKLPKLLLCSDPKISSYNFNGEDAAYGSIKVKGLRKEKQDANAEKGPCWRRGGWHTNVGQGKGYIASIVGCPCCDDASGKAIKKEKARVDYH
jgi:hypothetical protein